MRCRPTSCARATGRRGRTPSRQPDMENKTLDLIRESIPDYARDLKLNLGSVLTPEGAPGLSQRQIWAVAVAAAIGARNPAFTRALEVAASEHLDAAHLNAARAAAAIMGMNNIYYRFLHLVEDPEYQTLPARRGPR